MHVVTFYSYKGGVGRTMALVNVAHLLASAGKRVLVVDFDLEAPGLSSYGPFRCAGDHPGLVEYVLAYLDSNTAPDAADYITECRTGDHAIWLMPAGRHTEPGYAAKFGSINWQDLYREREGFLLFEDLRQQWALHDGQGFDYVLIDSRTGHTDIGGICTRQLPDAVVIQFLPTAQNVEGLRPIVDGIRGEGAPVRRDRVRLLFCPSNLPENDDQELILKRALERARAALNYKQSAAEIFHYGSLDLLEQPVYTATSPNSRLAAEYGNLHRAIIGHNLEDRDGAIIALDRMRADFQLAFTGAAKSHDEGLVLPSRADAAFISARFPQDVEIQWRLAILAGLMTQPQDELNALNVVVEVSRTDIALALLRRARARASLDDQPGALDDLKRLLRSEVATNYEVGPATELLRRLDASAWRDVLREAALNPLMASNARSQLIQSLMTERDEIPALVELAKGAASLEGAGADGTEITLALVLIADGRFEEAMNLISPVRSALFATNSMPDFFNYGICEWSVTGIIPVDIFSEVLTIRTKLSPPTDANGLQCFALCQYLLGRPREALEDLRKAQLSAQRVTSVFSCWRYLSVTSKGMLEDLDEMNDAFVRAIELRPPTRGGLKGANAN